MKTRLMICLMIMGIGSSWALEGEAYKGSRQHPNFLASWFLICKIYRCQIPSPMPLLGKANPQSKPNPSGFHPIPAPSRVPQRGKIGI